MTRHVLVVDGANVVGSRPDGWWRDRAGAAARLSAALHEAALEVDRVVLVLEGRARAGVPAGIDRSVQTVHAEADGDSTIVQLTADALAAGLACEVVTADRALSAEVKRLGAAIIGPRTLWQRLDR